VFDLMIGGVDKESGTDPGVASDPYTTGTVDKSTDVYARIVVDHDATGMIEAAALVDDDVFAHPEKEWGVAFAPRLDSGRAGEVGALSLDGLPGICGRSRLHRSGYPYRCIKGPAISANMAIWDSLIALRHFSSDPWFIG